MMEAGVYVTEALLNLTAALPGTCHVFVDLTLSSTFFCDLDPQDFDWLPAGVLNYSIVAHFRMIISRNPLGFMISKVHSMCEESVLRHIPHLSHVFTTFCIEVNVVHIDRSGNALTLNGDS